MPFQKGNKLAAGNRGNSFEAREIKHDLIIRAIKAKEKFNQKLVNKAAAGDLGAIKEVYDRTVGKAIESVDVTSGGEKIIPWANYVIRGNNSTDKDKGVPE